MALPKIHTFYHVWFKWVDPLVLVPTIFALIFTPEMILDAFVPASITGYNPDQGFLFHQLAAMFAFIGMMLGGLLRISDDIKVWRGVIWGVLVVDIAMLGSLYASLKQQDRLHMEAMRSGDWGNIVFTVLVSAIRMSFLAGVGVEDEGKSKRL